MLETMEAKVSRFGNLSFADWGSLATTGLGGAYVTLVLWVAQNQGADPTLFQPADLVFPWILLLGIFVFAFACVLVEQPMMFRTLMAVRFVVIQAFFALTVPDLNVKVALFLPFVVDWALYERYPVSLWAIGFSLLLFLVGGFLNLSMLTREETAALYSRLFHGAANSQLPDFGLVLILGAIGVSTSAWIYYREKGLEQLQRMRILQNIVEKLTSSNVNYQNYALSSAARSKEDEKLRITREIHDVIGYTFTSNIMMMEAALALLHKDPKKVSELISEARGNTQEGLEKIRKSLYQLREQGTTVETLERRLYHLARVFRLSTNMKIDLDSKGLPEVLSPGVDDFISFFVQEAMTNSFVHGKANRIEVRFQRQGRHLSVICFDNGVSSSSHQEGIGLKGMRERLALLNGTLEVKPLAYGFQISADLPLAPLKENETHVP